MATNQRENIYNSYRSALRKQRGGRAASRRQATRKIIVDRYNIDYIALKEIIREFDERNGITHEHTAEYLAVLHLDDLQKQHQANPTPCPKCGSEDMVRYRFRDEDLADLRHAKPVLACFMCHLNLS